MNNLKVILSIVLLSTVVFAILLSSSVSAISLSDILSEIPYFFSYFTLGFLFTDEIVGING